LFNVFLLFRRRFLKVPLHDFLLMVSLLGHCYSALAGDLVLLAGHASGVLA
jgi:hypothetical protein